MNSLAGWKAFIVHYTTNIPKYEGGEEKLDGFITAVEPELCPLNWDQIKNILVSHFKDKRSEQDLTIELTYIQEKILILKRCNPRS